MGTGSNPCAPGRISVGIGSWTDKEYKGLLYPKGQLDNERLKTYATWFDHVEVNSLYHAFQSRAVISNWASQTPAGFIFDVKLHKDFSEKPAAGADAGADVPRFLEMLRPMIDTNKLGAFLLLLPPRFAPGKGRLEQYDSVFEKLAPHPVAVEVRHRDWFEGDRREETLEFFRSRKLTCVGVDMPRVEHPRILPPTDEVTNPRRAYLRLHGRHPDWLTLKTQEERHTYAYSEDELKEIAARVRALAAQVDEVHVVANNHAQDFAPKTALALQRLLGLERKRPDAPDGLLPGF